MNSELTTLQSDLHHGKAQIGVLEAEVQSSRQLKDEAEEKWEKLVINTGINTVINTVIEAVSSND